MHLIHIRTAHDGPGPILELEYHVADPPPYAILSHRWGPAQDEVTFQDLQGDGERALRKKGYAKLKSFCVAATEYGLSHAWSDTCCIDKSSSAELSEAINSMYSWYESARVRFAYLEDVPARCDPRAPASAFRESVWFTRGWTLQELIAPSDLIFVSSEWDAPTLGSKASLADLVEEITGVREDVLLDRRVLQSASVAEKMSWAAGRCTTRLEDEAYSLLGLFGVNMATIYGEGRRAFRRLQEEIMRSTQDHSIFAWNDPDACSGMLAHSPRQFSGSAGYKLTEYTGFFERFRIENSSSLDLSYSMTNSGLRIQLPVVQMPSFFGGIVMAFLCCFWNASEKDQSNHSTIIFLTPRSGRPTGHYTRIPFDGHTVIHRSAPLQYRDCASPQLLWISGEGGSFDGVLNPSPTRSFRITHTTSFSVELEVIAKNYVAAHQLLEVDYRPVHQPRRARPSLIKLYRARAARARAARTWGLARSPSERLRRRGSGYHHAGRTWIATLVEGMASRCLLYRPTGWRQPDATGKA